LLSLLNNDKQLTINYLFIDKLKKFFSQLL